MSSFAAIGGVTLHNSVQGRVEGTPLIFINALGGDLRIWDAVALHLTDLFHVVRYDLRGQGLSDCPPAPYSIRDHSGDLLGLLDHLRISEAILAGISVGGLIAMDCAAAHPNRVCALVLCDTAPRIGSAPMWNERIDALRRHGMEHLADAILARWFAPSFAQQQPAAYRGYYNMLARTPVTGYIGTCEALRDADLWDGVSAITAKTLVLCGAEDVATSPELGRQLVEALPDARFVEIADAAHLACIEQPQAVADAVRQFLKDARYGG